VSDEPYRERGNDRRVGVLLMLGLAVIFGGLYVAGYYFTSDKVPNGSTVAGEQIGGLTPSAARRAVVEGLRADANAPIIVSAGGERAAIDPKRAGLRLDATESVAQAGGGRSWDPGRMWDFFAGGESHDAVTSVDDAKLEAAIEPLGKKLDRPAKEGRIIIANGRAKPAFPRPGQSLDQQGAADAIAAAYLSDTEVVALSLQEVDPEVSQGEVHEAMDDFANPAMSAPVVISLDGERVVLRPEAYSSAISVANRDGELVPILDEKALLRGIRPAMSKVSVSPKEATVTLVGGRPQVVPGRTGVTFDKGEITGEFLRLVVAEGDGRTLEVDSVEDRPDFSASDARALQIKTVVSSFTTNYPHADYRNTNLGKAAEQINGTVLKPGETFSLNETVGERTAANGFVEGFIISDGIYEEDFGGGVSQVATTTFNAAFFAGLEDVEHTPHSFYIDRYPIGREATVAWGAVDLRFKNDTPYGVLVQAYTDPSTPVSEGAMTVRMWSTKHWDIEAGVSEQYNFTEEETRTIDDDECTPNVGYGGFDVDVYRYFRKPDTQKVVREETMHTTYTPSDSVICE